ncbi:MAG TPA: MBOAT family O-acyltransferase, partial [Burkholderiales bacterium]|nr:MBOAT family O-acyltransferase [Burkholderiales bacterium]
MLFNSSPFLFGFLPLAFAGFFLLARAGHFLAASWLTLASLFFYGWWNPAYLGLLLGSIVFNFAAGTAIGRAVSAGDAGRARILAALAIGADLALLGYYKYTDFFLANLNALAGTSVPLPHIVLPLGISFFTFTQIAFLADTYQGKVKEYRFVHYALFVTYFPHLIAGPILHHKEMMPQFARATTYRLHWEHVAVGLTIFLIGLFKKTVLADGIAQYVGPVFSAHGDGVRLPLLDTWGGLGQWLAAQGVEFQNLATFGGSSQVNFILVSTIIVWAMPNTQQILAAWKPALNLPPDTVVSRGRWWAWKPTPAWLLVTL